MAFSTALKLVWLVDMIHQIYKKGGVIEVQRKCDVASLPSAAIAVSYSMCALSNLYMSHACKASTIPAKNKIANYL